MKNNLSFAFVLAFVSLYSSMTCSRVTAVAASPIVITRSEKVAPTNSASQFANAAPSQPASESTLPARPTPPALVKSSQDRYHNSASRVIAFLNKLRTYELSWALMPVPRPHFIKGIYLTNGTAISTKTLTHFVNASKKHGINTLVIDAQGKNLTAAQMSLIKSNGLYPVARIVCFDLGLKEKYPDKRHVDEIMAAIQVAAKTGFREIQLDYIRYADSRAMQRLPLAFKYEQIGKILARARTLTDSLGVELGADVFGRITLNQNDQIGQRLELFGEHVHSLYPMVYPSHYYGDPEKIANPYGTVKEGVKNSIERIPKTRIVPYIQGFGMKIKQARLTLPEYVLKQLYAVDDADGNGYVVWNARNDYSATWKALREYDKHAAQRKKARQIAQNKAAEK